ncbi:MAG: hypothetical protein J7M25_14495 [Deltaproteobacteria bacterium]|nr:hypothetical protein [Deltaproteobacteria bacterium]
MRVAFFLGGMALLAVALYLGYHAALLIDSLKTIGLLSFEVWTDAFWLVDPANYHAGLGPNGKWFTEAFGAFWAFVIGYSLVRTSTRMSD